MQDEQFPVEVIWTTLGIIGGVAKVFGKWLNETPKNWREAAFILCLNMFISGFSGYMGALISANLFDHPQYQLITAGVFGYLGVFALDTISKKYLNNFTNKIQ